MHGIVRRSLCFLASAVLLAGCQKLDYEQTLKMEAGDVKSFPVDPPRSEQKVTVTVTSTIAPVNVYLVLEKDQEAALKALDHYQKPVNPLASQEKTQDATLEATVPAKTGYVVLLAGATKDTEVKIKITGR